MTPEQMTQLEGVVRYAARQAAGSMLEFEDAQQVAWLAILEALDDYDPSRASLETYAQRVAVGAVRNAANGFSSAMSVPKSTMNRYRTAVRAYGSAEAAYEHADEFKMTQRAFYDAHVAYTGGRSLDESLTRTDDYTGSEEEAAPVEAALPFEWDNTPDFSVWEAIETLSEKQQEAMLLYARGLSSVEIGARLGISKQSAHERVHTGLESLRGIYSQP